jgi:hypothetical protein
MDCKARVDQRANGFSPKLGKSIPCPSNRKEESGCRRMTPVGLGECASRRFRMARFSKGKNLSAPAAPAGPAFKGQPGSIDFRDQSPPGT